MTTHQHRTEDGTDTSAIDNSHPDRRQGLGELDHTVRPAPLPVDQPGARRHRPELHTIFALGWLAAILCGIETLWFNATTSDPAVGDPAPSHSAIFVTIALIPPITAAVAIVVALLYWRCVDCGRYLRSNGYEIPQYCAKCGSHTGA